MDDLIESKENQSDSNLTCELSKRIKKLKEITENRYAKEIENLYNQVQHLKSIKHVQSNSLQESIDQLRESLTVSEKTLEENIQRRIQAECKKVYEDIRNTLKPEEIKLNASSEEIKIISPTRLSGLEQQYKSELDAINNDDLLCGTGRSISFGMPEIDGEILLQENKGINNIIEEYKKKLDQQKTEEIEMKTKEFNVIIRKLKEQMENQIKHYEELILKIKQEHINELAVSKSSEDLLKFKEKELRATLNSENMKILNEKKNELTRQYMENRETLFKDFEVLKQKLYNEVEEKTGKIENEYQNLIKECENRNNELEQKYNTRIEEKEKQLNETMHNKIKEMEEEFRIKIEKIEYDVKYESQCQTEKKRAEFNIEQKDIIQKHKVRIDELESKLKLQESEHKVIIDQLHQTIKKLQEQNESKCEQVRKKTEKDLLGKLEQFKKKCKDLEENGNKFKQDFDSLNNKTEEEKKAVIESIVKKYKEELKLLKEKHKIEIRNIKEMHKNDNIKKGIEKDREIKKLNSLHTEEIELLKKEREEPRGDPGNCLIHLR